MQENVKQTKKTMRKYAKFKHGGAIIIIKLNLMIQ